MIRALLTCLALVAFSAQAADTRVYQTDKYGSRQQPAYAVVGDKVYLTDKHGNRLYQAYVVKDDKVYETDKYGSRRQQVFEIKSPKTSNHKPWLVAQ